MTTRFFAELYRRNRLLTLIGWLHVLLLIATLIGLATDDRQVMGINTWIKPMKFMVSLVIYLWTIAWFSRYIGRPRWAIRTVSAIIATVIVIESACLLLQAARATTSHFNVSTDFDAAIFQTMGAMISIDLAMSAFILFMFTRPSLRPALAYLWGIRAGLVMFLLGGAIGVVMIVNNAHTVGGADGGPGLPFLNWSTAAGDLRIAHGLALHGLQVFPLLGYAVTRWGALSTNATRLAVLAFGIAGYVSGVYFLFDEAMAGNSLI